MTRYEPDALTIETEAAAPGLLVVREAYSGDWRALVDGEQAPVLATNHALRVVPVPAGEHRVELRYEPRSLRHGLWISAVSSGAMLVAFAAAGRACLPTDGRGRRRAG